MLISAAECREREEVALKEGPGDLGCAKLDASRAGLFEFKERDAYMGRILRLGAGLVRFACVPDYGGFSLSRPVLWELD